jgi:excisionase family DNA binding protein
VRLAAAPPSARYLSVPEAADILGVSRRTVLRRVWMHELPALHVGPTLLRVEGWSIDDQRPYALPDDVPDRVGIAWLSSTWRVNDKLLHKLVHRRWLPMERGPGGWSMSRRAFIRTSIDNTTGDGSW